MAGRGGWVIVAVLVASGCKKPDAAAGVDAGPPDVHVSTSFDVPTDLEDPAPPPRPTRPTASAAAAAAASAAPPTTWTWSVHKGDHFRVSLPGEPKVTVLPAEEDRAGYTEARVDVPGGQVSFAIGFSDHQKEEVAKPDTFLDDRINAPRRGVVDLLHKRTVTLASGSPGRVMIVRQNLSGTPLRVYTRLYLVGRRLYSLIVSTLDSGGVGEDVVKRFMDSFQPT